MLQFFLGGNQSQSKICGVCGLKMRQDPKLLHFFNAPFSGVLAFSLWCLWSDEIGPQPTAFLDELDVTLWGSTIFREILPSWYWVNRTKGLQPYNHTTLRLNNLKTLQAYNLTTLQAYNFTALQPCNPKTLQACNIKTL